MNEHANWLALWTVCAVSLLAGCASKCGLPPADQPPPSLRELSVAVDAHAQDSGLHFGGCMAPFWIHVPSKPWGDFLQPDWVVHDKGPGARDPTCAWVSYVNMSPAASQPIRGRTVLFVFRDGSLQSVIDTMSTASAPGEGGGGVKVGAMSFAFGLLTH